MQTEAAGGEAPPGVTDRPPVSLTPERLAREYAPLVYRFSAMVCRDQAQSEDLAQDALVRAMKVLHRFDPTRGSVEGWLWRIVVNLARDRRRAAGRWAMVWERLVAGGSREETEEPVESLVLRQLRDAELLEAVRALPCRQRTLIGLRFGAQLSYAEIAAQFGQNEPAVKQATYRALTRLRKRLEETPR